MFIERCNCSEYIKQMPEFSVQRWGEKVKEIVPKSISKLLGSYPIIMVQRLGVLGGLGS